MTLQWGSIGYASWAATTAPPSPPTTPPGSPPPSTPLASDTMAPAHKAAPVEALAYSEGRRAGLAEAQALASAKPKAEAAPHRPGPPQPILKALPAGHGIDHLGRPYIGVPPPPLAQPPLAGPPLPVGQVPPQDKH